MKRFTSILILTLVFGFIIFNQSCSYDKCNETIKYQVFNPVYMTKAQLRNISIEEAKPLKNPGKIYVFGKYLFINEFYKGVHIFDNSDKANPINLSFISIPGNVDIAVKENTLYADNFLDLLYFDISDPQNPKYLSSIENTFITNKYEATGRGYLIYYEPSDVFEEVDCSNSNFNDQWFRTQNGDILYDNSGKLGDGIGAESGGANFGVGGSMARFTIMSDRLYTVDNTQLNVFNIENTINPYSVNKVDIGWGIETIFPLKENLFIGSNNGMYIYSTTNPDYPILFSSFVHATACDPIFVADDIAYVTLRSGNRCRGIKNQLDVIDVKDLLKPELIKTYSMDNPHGLSVIGKKLILCEGDYGLKVLDVNNPLEIKVESKLTNNHFYDVIGLNENHIILIGVDGLYQYKLEGYELKEIGSIPISN